MILIFEKLSKTCDTQTCVQRPHLAPQKEAVVDRRSLLGGHLVYWQAANGKIFNHETSNLCLQQVFKHEFSVKILKF